MASEPIHISDDSELPRLFDEAAERPVVVKRKGKLFRVSVVDDDPDEPSAYDPEALRAAIDEVSDLFTDEEAEEMIRKIYEYRKIGSRPETRP